MVERDGHAYHRGELIAGLHAVTELKPGAQALTLRGRTVEVPIMDRPAQTAGHEEPIGEREQRMPGTATPRQPQIAIVGRTSGIDRHAQMGTRRPQRLEAPLPDGGHYPVFPPLGPQDRRTL